MYGHRRTQGPHLSIRMKITEAREPMTEPENLSILSVPAFWPMAMATTMLKEGTELYARNLKFVEEEIQQSWRAETCHCDAEPSSPRSADHGAASSQED